MYDTSACPRCDERIETNNHLWRCEKAVSAVNGITFKLPSKIPHSRQIMKLYYASLSWHCNNRSDHQNRCTPQDSTRLMLIIATAVSTRYSVFKIDLRNLRTADWRLVVQMIF